MYELNTSVEVGQASFNIRNKGDFRMVLDCFKVLHDDELSDREKLIASLIIFYEDFNDISDIPHDEELIVELQKGMTFFFNGGSDEFSSSNTGGHVLVDWEKDSNLICSAINNVAKQEIRALDYLHWWTFLGYYSAIGECLYSTILSIRYKIAHNEKLDKPEKKFRQNNPEYFNIDMRSREQREAEAYAEKLWNGGT